MTSQNVLTGWHGAGFFPFNSFRVLHQIDETKTTSPLLSPTIQTSTLISSSLPDAIILRASNTFLNSTIANSTLSTPVRNQVHHLSGIAEQLHADNSILRKENEELK